MAITCEQCKELLDKQVITKAEYNDLIAVSVSQSVGSQSKSTPKLKKRKTAAILGILLGSFWAQKIYLKQINPAIGLAIIVLVLLAEMFNLAFSFYSGGVYSNYGGMLVLGAYIIPTQIVLSVFSVLLCVNAVIGLIEGVIYLTLSEDKFQRIYIDGSRKWF